jgi:hypothetical protein
MKEFVVFVGLSSGNFVAELFSNQNFELATERSYFQGVALLAYWICTNCFGSKES